MVVNVKLKAALPKDAEANGLTAAAESFLVEPRKPRVAIVVLQREGYDHDDATGEDVPKLRITRIEPIVDDAEAEELVNRAQALAGDRTGYSPLLPESSAGVDALDGGDAS